MATPRTAAVPSRDRHQKWWLLAVTVPFVIAACMRLQHPPAATDGDYAHYLLHAQALADGRPYTDVGFIHTELNLVGPRNQPPGWPVVLAPFVRVFGVHSPVIRLLVIALVAAFAWIAGHYAARTVNLPTGIAVAAVTPLALQSEGATGSALSDPLFCLLFWGAIWFLHTPETWRRVLVAVLLAAAAISVRLAGIAIIPALALHALLHRRELSWSRLALIAGLAVVVIAVALVAGEQIPFIERVAGSLPELWTRMARFPGTYRHAVTAAMLYPFPSNVANDVYHAAVAVPMVIGAWRFLIRDAGSAAWCFALMYGLLLLLSPLREPRYAWPLVPLMILWAVTGLTWIFATLVPKAVPRSSRPGFVALAAIVVGTVVQLARQPAPRSLQNDPDTIQLFDWVRTEHQRTGDSLRIVYSNPRVLTLYTGASAMGVPWGTEQAILDEFIAKHISHVVVQRKYVTRESERRVAMLVASAPGRFREVFNNDTYDVRLVAGADSSQSHEDPATTPKR